MALVLSRPSVIGETAWPSLCMAGLGASSVFHTLFLSQLLCFEQRATQLLLSSEVGLPLTSISENTQETVETEH